MNYWITTHWPPREKTLDDLKRTGVWLPNGRQQAGAEIRSGDRLLIYQSKTGRPERRRTVDGEEIILRCQQGREGIVAVAELTGRLSTNGVTAPTEYADGTKILWCWEAPATIISRSGFVPRTELCRILGYASNYILRGFGDQQSGLKKITAVEYDALESGFRQTAIQPLPRFSVPPGRDEGSGAESEVHLRLKEFVAQNPADALGEVGLTTLEIEYPFPTGDRADIVLQDAVGRIVGVEIEVEVGTAHSQIAGVLQAIKYRYMLEAVRLKGKGESRAFLVAHSICEPIRKLCSDYEVEWFEVSRGRLLR